MRMCVLGSPSILCFGSIPLSVHFMFTLQLRGKTAGISHAQDEVECQGFSLDFLGGYVHLSHASMCGYISETRKGDMLCRYKFASRLVLLLQCTWVDPTAVSAVERGGAFWTRVQTTSLTSISQFTA